jgi:lipopolysaccharide transport system permease protein
MLSELKELWKFRELLLVMVQRELKIRYKNSALGFLWSMLNPLITVVVMSFAMNFMHRGGQGIPSVTAYLLAAYLPFIFFQLCLLDSSQTILTAMPLIKKIYFPREILPLASVISNFIHLLMALVMFFVYLLLVYIWSICTHGFHGAESPFQTSTVYLPILLVINVMLTLGLSFYISALNTFFEDVKYLVSVLTYLMLFLCPILYFEEQVANSEVNLQWHGLIYHAMTLNPVFILASAYRKVLVAPPDLIVEGGKRLTPMPLNWLHVGYAAGLSAVILVTGYHTFNKLKWRFVERP